MNNEPNEKLKVRLLKRLKGQWESPDSGLWEQYLGLYEKGVREDQVDAKKFNKIAEIISKPIFENVGSKIHDDQLIAINSVLKTLSPIQQKILRMTYWDGLSVRQIAKILRLPRSTVNRQKHTAIERMSSKNGTAT